MDGLGVNEPVIAKQGENRIRVELPDVTDSERAVDMIGKTAQLKFIGPDGNEVLTGQNVRNAEAVYQTLPPALSRRWLRWSWILKERTALPMLPAQ